MARKNISRRAFLHTTAAAGTAAVIGLGTATPAQAAAGFYNPFTGYAVSDGWAEHIARGSLGGIDYVMSVGTRLPAAGGGVVTNIPFNGTGGHTVSIQHDDGYRTQYMHLSQFLLGNGARVNAGDVVGLSGGAAGAPGSGSSTGPHCHWHMINPSGVRVNPLDYISDGGGPPPFDIWRDNMKLIQSTNRGIALVGPGYFRPLRSDEEVHAAVALVGNPVVGNDRQFDLWRSIAYDGQVKPPTA
ncbi:M23 family metallopeptidase [Phytomonospora sp. NPDC050363]|uniref:M23 family metallopeptidase n=1 Tax=Phytomonospora sp. NPDC050363 TaxID=3155642 RepID=UPI0033FBAEDD